MLMKLRRMLAILMSVMMLMSCLPLTAIAEAVQTLDSFGGNYVMPVPTARPSTDSGENATSAPGKSDSTESDQTDKLLPEDGGIKVVPVENVEDESDSFG